MQYVNIAYNKFCLQYLYLLDAVDSTSDIYFVTCRGFEREGQNDLYCSSYSFFNLLMMITFVVIHCSMCLLCDLNYLVLIKGFISFYQWEAILVWKDILFPE